MYVALAPEQCNWPWILTHEQSWDHGGLVGARASRWASQFECSQSHCVRNIYLVLSPHNRFRPGPKLVIFVIGRCLNPALATPVYPGFRYTKLGPVVVPHAQARAWNGSLCTDPSMLTAFWKRTVNLLTLDNLIQPVLYVYIRYSPKVGCLSLVCLLLADVTRSAFTNDVPASALGLALRVLILLRMRRGR